jgi:hypothetical protein
LVNCGRTRGGVLHAINLDNDQTFSGIE